MGVKKQKGLRYYIRINHQGEFVQGSDIYAHHIPKVGLWLDITSCFFACINATTTTTTSSTTTTTTSTIDERIFDDSFDDTFS